MLLVLERSADLTGYVGTALHHIHGHRQPLQFKITRDTSKPNAPAVMLCRTDADHPWEGINKTSEPIQLLSELPRGMPKLNPLRPYAEDDVKAVHETIAAETRTLPLIHEPEADALRQVRVHAFATG